MAIPGDGQVKKDFVENVDRPGMGPSPRSLIGLPEEDRVLPWFMIQCRNGARYLGKVRLPVLSFLKRPTTVDDGADEAAAAEIMMTLENGCIFLEQASAVMFVQEQGPLGKVRITLQPMDSGSHRISIRASELTFVQYLPEGSALAKSGAQQYSSLALPQAPKIVIP